MNRLDPKTEAALPAVFTVIWKALRGECRHDDYTVPMRLPGERELTVSCLRCAARLRYDWDRMRVADGQ